MGKLVRKGLKVFRFYSHAILSSNNAFLWNNDGNTIFIEMNIIAI